MRLYHFTCSHRARLIAQDRQLIPHAHPYLDGRPLVWLTDLDELRPGDAVALGLTSTMLHCDRTEWRCQVDADDALPWDAWWRGRVDPVTVSALTFGRRPAHWWVAEVPVAVVELVRS